MRKKQFIAAVKHIGLSVLDQNGLLIIHSGAGAIMYLRSRIFYTKPWLYLHCFLHRDLFDKGDWKAGYQSITSNNQQLNNMEQTFTNEEVRSYLSAYYTPSFRKGEKDHFYNFRNRKTIGLPLSIYKQAFTEKEIIDLFSDKVEHVPFIEMVRFKNFNTNNQIQ